MTGTSPRRLPRIRLLFATGLVLGVAATGTMAATSNDQIHAGTEVRIPAWNVEASFTSSTTGYGEFHDRPSAGILALNPAGNLRPGDVRYTAVHMRMGAKSTVGAYLAKFSEARQIPETELITGLPPFSQDLWSALSFRLTTSVDHTCTAAVFGKAGNYALASTPRAFTNTALTYDKPTGTDVTLSAAPHAQDEVPDAGAPVTFCFEFTLAATVPATANGKSAPVVFEVDFRSIH